MSACRSCGAPIEWVIAAKSGKRIPLDVGAVDHGNLVVVDGRAEYALGADPTLPRRISHFVTCPDAGSWRNRAA